jgi:hypothetical protein
MVSELSWSGKEMDRQSIPGTTRDFLPLIEIAMDAREFSAHWAQCDFVATYLARMISHNRGDSTIYSNLFSSAVNELLEIAYRIHKRTGIVTCRVLRGGEIDRVEIRIPCVSPDALSLLEAADRLGHPDSERRYLEALTSEIGSDPDIGLLELTQDYGAAVSISADDELITMTVDLRIDGLAG